MTPYLLLPIIQTLFCLILAVIVLVGHYRSFNHRLFSLFLLSLSIWGVVIFGMRSSPGLEHALVWEKCLIPTGLIMAAFFCHFSISYTGSYAGTRAKRWLIISLYGLFLILSPLVFTRLVFVGMQMKPYGYAPIMGPLMPIWMSTVYGILIFALLNFLRASRISQDMEQRNRSAYIVIGVLFSLVGGVFDILPALGLPVYPGAIIGNIIFCTLTTVAIVKYRLLDVRIILRKGTAYLLISTLIAIPYVGIIILINQIFKQAVPFWVNALLLIVIAIGLQPLWQRLQQRVDKWFYRERYDYLRALEDFSQATHNINSLDQIGASLVTLINSALQSSGACLLLRSGTGYFQPIASTPDNHYPLSLEIGNPLVRWLHSNDGILHRRQLAAIPLLQSLTAQETDELMETNAELFAPMKTKDKELVGILLVDKKMSQQPYTEEDERLLSSVLNRMAIELENARLYAQERVMREKVEKQDQEKTDFLHSVAHELKTPLAAIISSAELLSTSMSVVTPNQTERMAQNIVRGALSMDARISELLNLAQLQVGSLKLNLQPLEIGDAIKEIISQVRVLFKQKGQSLEIDVPDSIPKIKADRGRFEQILLNLLSNANKFSPAGKSIAVRVTAFGNKVLVEVEDSAPPIGEDERNKIFEPYYRGDDAEKRQRFPGLGLGLTITKKLVELHYGDIWVSNRSGRGNIFAFTLPVYVEREA